MNKDINECKSIPKIVLICFHFGKLPDYFNLWLKSVEKNDTVDFILFTDDKTVYNYPNNVFVEYCTFEYIRKFAQSKFDFNILIDRPYKFCDFRPAFGYIFYEKIKSYDFWGTCDLDVIFGNIRSFITVDILSNYDRILTRDHFVMYRNEPSINERFKSSVDGIKEFYKQVFTTERIYAFGERCSHGMYEIYKKNGWPMYDDPIIADIDVKWFNFRVTSDQNHKNRHQIFGWHKNGKLLRYYINPEGLMQSEEFMYIHLQKRKMKIESSSYDSFLIVPNKFVGFNPKKINKKIIRKYRNWKPLYYLRYLLIRK